MAHIGNGTEYSLHCLLYLVEKLNGVAPSARDMAEFQGISVSYVAKLFTKLEKSGLVSALEGRSGGFQLARPAEEISVLDVVDAVEGKKNLFDCKEIRANCVLLQNKPTYANKLPDICSIHAVMLQADRAMRQSLASTSLADIAQSVSNKIPRDQKQETVEWFAERANSRSHGFQTITPANQPKGEK